MLKITIGTRGSALARVQADFVAAQLRAAYPGLEIIIRTYVTKGDKSQATNTPLASYSEKGIFVKELEIALLSGDIDAAVHSTKDLAATLPFGLRIAAMPPREDVRDVIVGTRLTDLCAGATVGTGSVRRRALLGALRPDLTLLEIRGNVDTRIRKLRDGSYDAIVLAAAGLNRLGRSGEIAEYLDCATFTPDPGQGAIAIEARSEDADTLTLLSALNDPDTSIAVSAERAFLAALGGGCQTPVGALAIVKDGEIILSVMVAGDAGVRRLTVAGSSGDPVALGIRAAREAGS